MKIMEKNIVDYLKEKRSLEEQIMALNSKENLTGQEMTILDEIQRRLNKVIRIIESMS